jgi:hypothetical protein
MWRRQCPWQNPFVLVKGGPDCGKPASSAGMGIVGDLRSFACAITHVEGPLPQAVVGRMVRDDIGIEAVGLLSILRHAKAADPTLIKRMQQVHEDALRLGIESVARDLERALAEGGDRSQAR